jgi:hypothetical protein
MLLKTKAFVFGAGKIILAISIYGLWLLWSWGKFNNAETIQFSKRKMQEYHKRN